MTNILGPRDRTTEMDTVEELEALEAFQSADEYLNMEESDTEEIYFETEE